MNRIDHTPGPWSVITPGHGHETEWRCVMIDAEKNYSTLELLPADAAIVAAAPDMYALLCRMCGGGIPGWTVTADIMREARGLFDRMHATQEAKTTASRDAEMQAAIVAAADEIIRAGYSQTNGVITIDALRYRLTGIIARHVLTGEGK